MIKTATRLLTRMNMKNVDDKPMFLSSCSSTFFHKTTESIEFLFSLPEGVGSSLTISASSSCWYGANRIVSTRWTESRWNLKLFLIARPVYEISKYFQKKLSQCFSFKLTSQKLHKRLRADFRHAIKNDNLVVSTTCVVQWQGIQCAHLVVKGKTINRGE